METVHGVSRGCETTQGAAPRPYPRIVGRVILHDPVNGGDIEAAGRDVRAQQNAGLRVAKLEKGLRALLLLLPALPLTSCHDLS